MTKSTITRERIQRIIRAIDSEAYDEEEIREWLSSDEIMELARMALSAMDSEPEYLPLDYLQGQKDGLEWAAQLAEANHPETGEWLYDDPIELAKAIRKGPDMPPVQPVADSEPDRNPVLAYADSYRDMAKQGVESVPIWSVITDLERNIAPLYRHAQPAPVVPEEMTPEMMRSVQLNSELGAYAASNLSGAYDLFAEFWKEACRAAMLAAATQSPGSDPATVPGKWIPVSEQMPDDDDFVYIWPRPDFGVELHVGQYCERSHKGGGWYAQVYEQNHGIEWHPITVTHWMQLPAAPQEVK
ncbi:DUF551 domain-containing protein [Klebsiella pneumoniae]|uniref:DUF551 domain-containing protein n=1 Tax=Klebsiella pneumoniae TaxID=573 RepID=UPI003B590845